MNHQSKWTHASTGDPVWISDPDEAYLDAAILSIKGDTVVVETKSGKIFTVDCSIQHDRYIKPTQRFVKKSEEPPRRLLPRGPQRGNHGIENMDDLHPLNEASILANIEFRFRIDNIYTRTGPILIAMNPFKWLPLYGDEVVRQYHNRPYGSLPPHCFQEAEDAYQQLQFTHRNQSVVICGESGAGKTETTKLMLQYLSIVAREKSATGGKREKTIGEKLVQSNPLMEAFGNAKTLRNNNSSRFGKFTLLNFGKTFYISGGKVSNFLLEKSRVVRQQKGERNYHIFYQLVAGASDGLRSRLQLPEASAPDSFYYLSQSGCLNVDGLDDAEEFSITRRAMEAVSIMGPEQDDMFALVAGVLHLGNVEFDSSTDNESSTVRRGGTALGIASELLGLDPSKLEEAITTRVRLLPGGNTVRSPQTDVQSRDSRDALSKAVYNKLFDNLVTRINKAFDRDDSAHPAFIGILDIFGFEDLASNGFEQLLINFTNEKLQLLFNETTFKMEEEEYMREQIQWDRTDFPDNQPCVDLIEKKPMGLLPVLDSECSRGGAASDATLVATYNKHFKSHANFSVCGPSTGWRRTNESHSLTNHDDFVVIHFAGPVIYTCVDFVDRNRDALFEHVNSLMGTSKNKMIKDLFQARDDGASALRAATVTVSNRFTTQLSNLINTLESCNSRFVRCIKSNNLLAPQVIDKPSVLKQLICSGVMAALEVRRAGFPTRIKYSDFVKDFRVFTVGLPKPVDMAATLSHSRTRSQVSAMALNRSASREVTDRELVARMMTHPTVIDSITAKQYRLGVSKLFLQADALLVLQSIKNRAITPQITKLQRWWIKQSQNVLAHKLKRVIATLAELQLKAEVAGIHRLRHIKSSLEECAAAVRYAKGLGLLNPDVFRPAVNTASQKLSGLREFVNKAIEAKEREMAQRAELLQLLDSGRARLGHVRNGLTEISLSTESVASLLKRASDGIEQRSADLLRDANRDVANFGDGGEDSLSFSLSSSALQRMKREVVSDQGDEYEDFDDRGIRHEAAMRQRQKRVEDTLALVDSVETEFTALQAQQKIVDSARAKAKAALATHKGRFAEATHEADEASVGHVPVLKQMVVTTTEAIRAAEVTLVENDVEAFDHVVGKAGFAVGEFAALVEAEKKRKAEDDLRGEGKALLAHAGEKLHELLREAEAAGVRQADAFVAAVRSVEGEISATSLLISGEPKAYVAACRKVAGGLDNVRATLKAEKQKKDKNEQARASELARLQPSIESLRDVQAGISRSFELASEEALCSAVSAAAQSMETLLASLDKSDNVGSLRDRVDGLILQCANVERLFSEVKQRHEIRLRDLGAAKDEWEGLEKRLAALVLSMASDGDILAQLTEEVIIDARDALAEVDRTLRNKASVGDVLRNVVRAAGERVDKVKSTIRSQRQRIATAEHLREDELARLDLAERRLIEFVSELSPLLKGKDSVKDTIGTTEAAVRGASERLRRRVTYAWLQNDELKQERALVSEVIGKVERAESLLLDEKKRHEAYLRDAKGNQGNLEFATQKLHELQSLVEEAKIGRVAAVQAAMEECEGAHDVALRAVAAGESGDVETAKRAINTLLEKLKRSEAVMSNAKAQKEADDRERADVQNRLDAVLTRFQSVVAVIEAAGPTVKQLTEAMVREASGAVNASTKLLRRGDNVKELNGAVRLAIQKVDALEAEAQAAKDRAEHASKIRASVSRKIASLDETFALCVDKAEAQNVRSVGSVETALRLAEEALYAARRRAHGELEVFMADGTSISRLVDDAATKVEAAEEVVDEEAQSRERMGREKGEVQRHLDSLMTRHDNVVREGKANGAAFTESVQRALEATEQELAAVRGAMANSSSAFVAPSLSLLTRLVTAEEEALGLESRRVEMRSAEVQRAAADLPTLHDKLKAVDALLRTPILSSASVPPQAEEAYHGAQKAVWAIARFVSEGSGPATTATMSLNSPVPRTDTAHALLHRAEELLSKHVSYLQGVAQRRDDAMQRLTFLERRFGDLQEEVAEFCAKSDHLRVQLDADWGDNCWWGSQSSHTQTNGSPMGRGEMQPISSVAVITDAVANVETSMSAVKKRVEGDLNSWVEASSAVVHRLLDETLAKMDRAMEVLEAEKLRMRREEAAREAAVRSLDHHADRLARLRVCIEVRRIGSEGSVMEHLSGAEAALDAVSKLLESGNAAASPAAMGVAARKIAELDDVVTTLLQRKDRYDAQKGAARTEVTKLSIRAQALTQLAEMLDVANSEGVKDAIRGAEKAVERALLSLSSGELPMATIGKEVRGVLVRIENAEREVRRERTRKDELARLRQQQQDEARSRSARDAEEGRMREEQERLYRSQLELELGRMSNRVLSHHSTLERLSKSLQVAEEAIKTARHRLAKDTIISAQAATQSALAMVTGFESNADATAWGGAGGMGLGDPPLPSPGSSVADSSISLGSSATMFNSQALSLPLQLSSSTRSGGVSSTLAESYSYSASRSKPATSRTPRSGEVSAEEAYATATGRGYQAATATRQNLVSSRSLEPEPVGSRTYAGTSRTQELASSKTYTSTSRSQSQEVEHARTLAASGRVQEEAASRTYATQREQEEELAARTYGIGTSRMPEVADTARSYRAQEEAASRTYGTGRVEEVASHTYGRTSSRHEAEATAARTFAASGRVQEEEGSRTYAGTGRAQEEAASRTYGGTNRQEEVASRTLGRTGSRHEADVANRTFAASGRAQEEAASRTYGTGRVEEVASHTYGRTSSRHEAEATAARTFAASGRVQEEEGSRTYGVSGRVQEEAASRSYGAGSGTNRSMSEAAEAARTYNGTGRGQQGDEEEYGVTGNRLFNTNASAANTGRGAELAMTSARSLQTSTSRSLTTSSGKGIFSRTGEMDVAALTSTGRSQARTTGRGEAEGDEGEGSTTLARRTRRPSNNNSPRGATSTSTSMSTSTRPLSLSMVEVTMQKTTGGMPEEQLAQLMERYYSSSVFESLRGLVTRGGVRLQDCVANGNTDGGEALEVFAGDAESYSLFNPLFEPVIRSCHPLFDGSRTQPVDMSAKSLALVADPDPMGTHVRKARLLVARNLDGFNLTPKMSVSALREVERKICLALNNLTGRLAGTYTTMQAVMEDRALQQELEAAELPQTYRLTESPGMLSAWPEGRGIFLNADRSLCIFVNVEDHLTIVCTANAGGGAAQAKEVLKLADKTLEALSQFLNFAFDPYLGFITPSPAKLGTAMAFSLVLTLPSVSKINEEEVEAQFPHVCVEKDSMRGPNCVIAYSKVSLGASEADAVRMVLDCTNMLLHPMV